MSDRPVALITGASRGIGKGLALAFAEDGFQIALVARSINDLEKVAEEVRNSFDVPCLCVPADLSKSDSISGIVKMVLDKFKRIDVLINNAGMGAFGTLDVSVETFEQLFAVNLRSPFLLMQQIVPVMIQQGTGLVVNISSRAGKIGFAEWGAYAA